MEREFRAETSPHAAQADLRFPGRVGRRELGGNDALHLGGACGSRLGRGSRAGVRFLPGETLPGLCQCCVSRAAEEMGEVKVLDGCSSAREGQASVGGPSQRRVRALPPLRFPAPVGNPQH